MNVMPLRKYQRPKYPDRSVLDRHPELLRLVPERWRGNALVIGALTLMCAVTFSGRKIMAVENPNATAPRIAPIFSHGEGRGAFGCVATNPPEFLSEAEARQVILEEGKKAGISFTPDVATQVTAALPITSVNEPCILGVNSLPLTLDGFDSKLQIGYEFISARDYRAWFSPDEQQQSSVARWYILDAAEAVRAGMKKTSLPGSYAVFYDPCAGWKDTPQYDSLYEEHNQYGRTIALPRQPEDEKKLMDYDAHDACTKLVARQELRKQVIDFIQWLKVQGVI